MFKKVLSVNYLILLMVILIVSISMVSAENLTEISNDDIGLINDNSNDYISFNYTDEMTQDEVDQMKSQELSWYEQHNWFADRSVVSSFTIEPLNGLESDNSFSQNEQLRNNIFGSFCVYNTNVQQGTTLNAYSVNSQGERIAQSNLVFYFWINTIYYTRTSNEYGIVFMNINLPIGSYPITMGINGVGQTSFNINVYKKSVNLTAYGKTLHQGDRFYVKLTDGGVPLPNKVVKIEVNGETYTRTTGIYGNNSLKINLPVGSYQISYYAVDQLGYNPSQICTDTLVVKQSNANLISTSISNENSVFMKNGTFNVKLKNNNGVGISNKLIKIWINGIYKQAYTDNSGVAHFSLGSSHACGVYSVSINFDGDSSYKSSSAYSLILMVNNENILYFNNDGLVSADSDVSYVEECNYTNPYISSLASNLTSSCTSDLEKLVACYYYTASIDCTEITPFVNEHDALDTICDNKGNYRSHTNVLVSLMRFSHIPTLFVFGVHTVNQNHYIQYMWNRICIDGVKFFVDSYNGVPLGSDVNLNYDNIYIALYGTLWI